jgi:hypothetical protein
MSITPVSARDLQEKALRRAMSEADESTVTRETRLVNIRISNGRQRKWLCGMPYLWTQYIERAYVIDENTGRNWIKTYDIVLSNAEMVPYRT